MNVLFIQGGSRVRICENGLYYVDGNFNEDVWNRYVSYCDELTVILRKIDAVFNESEIKHKLNFIDSSMFNLKLVLDVYSPKLNYINIKKRKMVKKVIEDEVRKSDKIIIRSLGNFYTNTALKYCKKYNKEYLIEVTGFAFETLWYHSFFGKILSIYRELYTRKSLKYAPFAVYVTNNELQKRYPSNGKMLGCSDVELFKTKDILKKKEERIKKDADNNEFILGTAGFLDVSFKGQKDVIKAINYLSKKGTNNIYYEMIGTGTGKKIKKLIDRYKLNDKIKIVGPLNHNDVMDWLIKIDVYVHPSYSEGLCRSIIEAMGLATPVICSNSGGNVELIPKKYIYPKKNWKSLATLIEKICNYEELIEQSNQNYNNSKKYDKDLLNKKRDEFYKRFVSKS